MKFNDNIPVYGDKSFRGECPSESAEQVTFFSRLRREYPDTWGLIAIHPRNEGVRHHAQTMRQKSEGMTPGAADIVIPGAPAFVCELKRRDHTKSRWQDGQVEYLEAAQKAGAFVCVALGCDAAWQASVEWIEKKERPARSRKGEGRMSIKPEELKLCPFCGKEPDLSDGDTLSGILPVQP